MSKCDPANSANPADEAIDVTEDAEFAGNTRQIPQIPAGFAGLYFQRVMDAEFAGNTSQIPQIPAGFAGFAAL